MPRSSGREVAGVAVVWITNMATTMNAYDTISKSEGNGEFFQNQVTSKSDMEGGQGRLEHPPPEFLNHPDSEPHQVCIIPPQQ